MAAVDLITREDLAPLLDELRQVRAEVAELRAALPPAPLVSVEEAARLAGVSIATMRRRIKVGEVPSIRHGRTVRIDPVALRPPSGAQVIELAHRARFPR